MDDNITVQEARKLLWKEFDHVPDKSIELMIYCFDRIAQLLIEKIQREAEEKKKKRLAEESERKKNIWSWIVDKNI